MNRTKHCLILFALSIMAFVMLTNHAVAQVNSFEGKHFWLTFTKGSFSFGPNNIITIWSRTNTTVTIQNTAKGFSTTVSLVSNVPQDVNIPVIASNSDTGELVGNYGVEVIANDKIQVQLLAGNFGDGTMVYPVDHLGTEYYAMSFEASSTGKSALIVVATQDNTLIEITPSQQTGGGKQAGQAYQKTLNKGQTYRVEGFNVNDLTGTYVRVVNGCKPIAVFSGASCAEVPSSCTNCGELYEIMPHVDTWGKRFAIAPIVSGGFQSPQHTYRILSITNGTIVTVNGSSTTLNQGQLITVSGNKNNESFCVEASSRILIGQYTEGFGCQGGSSPRMMIVSPAEQMVKSGYIVGNSNAGFGNPNDLLIVIRTSARTRLRVNNSSVPISNFSSFGSCQEWSYVSINGSRGPHNVVCDSGFLAYTYNADFNTAYLVTAAVNSRITTYDIGTLPLTCGSTNVTFLNTGNQNRISLSQWFFDDNTTLTGKQVNKTFPAQGIYNVRNIVTYQDACPYVDTLTSTVRTLPRPVVGFTVNNQTQCFIGNNFFFSDTSRFINNSRRKTSFWEFSDTLPKFGNFLTFTRGFSKPGSVKVKLYVETTDLCIDSNELTVMVNANAKPDYQIANPQCFSSHLFSPVQKSTVIGSTIVGYEWDFGDGTLSTQATPSKTYAKDSTYNISLIAKAATGCNDTIRRTFTVYPSPKANFTTVDVCLNDTLKTVNSSTFAKGALTYLWKMGDGFNDTSTNIVKMYSDTGTYNIVLTATTADGCPDSVIKRATIKPAPKPAFTYDKKCTKNPSVFTNQTFVYGQPGAQYNWDMGDLKTFNTNNATYNYPKEGAYTVRLYAQLPNGCKDSTKRNLYINPIPNVNFIINDSLQCIRGNNFNFFNSTVLTEGKIKDFVWKLNDTFLTNSTSVNRIFTTHGVNTMKLVATTDSLCADSIVKSFEIAPQTNLLITTGPDTLCFNHHSFPIINGSSVPTGTVKYRWAYSNGDVDTVDHPAPKTFGASGRFQLSLLAVTNKGCRDSLTKTFTLYPSPEIDFEVSDVCGSDSARFINFSKVVTGRIVDWKWYLGDGGSADSKHPVHYYPAFGPYDVTLIGTTDLGCKDTLTIDTALTVKPAPKAFFNTALVEQRGNRTSYDFFDLSTGADNYYWNFDRGETSREKNPRFLFADTGAYHVILTVSNKEGCFSSYDTTITVIPDIEIFVPNAFSPNRDIHNPVYRIEGSYFYREFEMQIFDRWGQQVYRSTNPEEGWDGTFDGKLMPEGVYVYSIRIMGTDTRVRNYKGNLHLLY